MAEIINRSQKKKILLYKHYLKDCIIGEIYCERNTRYKNNSLKETLKKKRT